MRRNDGRFPRAAKGKRVRVRLFDGYDSASQSPGGWAADTTQWGISDPPKGYEVQEWELL